MSRRLLHLFMSVYLVQHCNMFGLKLFPFCPLPLIKIKCKSLVNFFFFLKQ